MLIIILSLKVITPRQGSVSVFQITLHKNINAYHRVEGVKAHTSLYPLMKEELTKDEKMSTAEVVCQPVEGN